MSDVRLRVKLISAGFDEDVAFGMERAELMTTYAELLASGNSSSVLVQWVELDIIMKLRGRCCFRGEKMGSWDRRRQ